MAPQAASFTAIEQVLDGHVTSGTRINVIGIVVDFRAPVPTRREDYKAQIRFYDESTQDDASKSLTINIFRKEDAMPRPSCGDVVVIFGAKVQSYQSELSLMTNWSTDVYVFTASSILKPPQDAKGALQALVKTASRPLTAADFAHVSAFYHRIDKERVPTADEYYHNTAKSVHVKEKFSLLKDVACDRFVDVIAEVVREPYDMGDKFTLWISDYTEHSNFYNFSMPGLVQSRSDPYNYTLGSNTAEDDWRGPYGKHSLQITCWEPHVAAIRANKISFGSWISIRNLQIKFGRNSSNLEGFLRGDQQYHNKIYISVLTPREDGDDMDPRLKDTIRRRREYGREKKKQLESIDDAARAGQKRRAALQDRPKPPDPNAKSRRNERRRAARDAAASEHSLDCKKPSTPEPDAPKTNLNSTIKCENEKQPISSVAELLEQVYFETLIGKEAVKLPLPFINANYRACVRVKDYLPHNLNEFAFAKLETKLEDCLSDAGDMSSDDDEDHNMDQFVDAKKIVGWEWRFYLLLEDARDTGSDQKDKVWVTVDNHAAQCLLNMNACDLKNSKSVVSSLRDKMFQLWGDLEEQKSKRLRRKEKAEKQARANGPPMDSDDEEASAAVTPSNRPFACCIKQYGVKIQEVDEAKADAGKGRRWKRMYGLFGTQIFVPDTAKIE
ncbi:telomere-binding alpha subunit central domain-containing protein [Cordyceps javanica]|uniref:Protection of telomeres protein 1 n=1 Tax=Cordyceps javanica TaxID=43265 RepID=A0A545VBY7_9HYPO|nr:telomere-binding alpha subunit central domain-containing protein [Cordyceps javanica]TQW11084.1 telomere-binding alpha subunit central domain protein [Cordyceps javanica]